MSLNFKVAQNCTRIQRKLNFKFSLLLETVRIVRKWSIIDLIHFIHILAATWSYKYSILKNPLINDLWFKYDSISHVKTLNIQPFHRYRPLHCTWKIVFEPLPQMRFVTHFNLQMSAAAFQWRVFVRLK